MTDSKIQLINKMEEIAKNEKAIPSALIDAIMFIKKLPEDIPLPNVFIESDKTFGLEWQFQSSSVIISILGDNNISFYARKCLEQTGQFSFNNHSKLKHLFSILETI
jgi:hypothetical protein